MGQGSEALRRRILFLSPGISKFLDFQAGERNCTMGIPDCGVVGSDEAGKFLTDTIISELVAAKPPDCCYRVASG